MAMTTKTTGTNEYLLPEIPDRWATRPAANTYAPIIKANAITAKPVTARDATTAKRKIIRTCHVQPLKPDPGIGGLATNVNAW